MGSTKFNFQVSVFSFFLSHINLIPSKREPKMKSQLKFLFIFISTITVGVFWTCTATAQGNNNGGLVQRVVALESVEDNDLDPTNELQTLNQSGSDVTLSDGGGTVSVDDADADATNELNTGVSLNGTTLEISDAGGTLSTDLSSLQDGVNDADADAANELQTVSRAGSNVTLSNGGGTVSVNDDDADPLNEVLTSAVLNGTDLEITDAAGTIIVDLSSLNGASGGNPDPPCFDNANRYVDCGNGTVTDTMTGLIWLQNANCFSFQDWATANDSAANLADGQCDLLDGSQAGDWRLPTIEEWVATIAEAVNDGCTFPNDPSLSDTAGRGCFAADPTPIFSGVRSRSYWSSTADATVPNFARSVDLSNGNANLSLKPGNFLVWPVRGGN